MILIVADHADGELRKSARELVTVAEGISGPLGSDVAALVFGGESASAAAEAMTELVSTVHLAQSDDLVPLRAETATRAIAKAADALGASVILVAASRSGLSIGPRVAARLGGALLEDVTTLDVVDGKLQATRLSYLSRVTETVRAESEPVVVSVKPNAFDAADGNASGAVQPLDVSLETGDTRVEVTGRSAAAKGRVALDEADVVVTGGRGVGSADAFAELVEPLADVLGGGVGSTRAVVDNGWRPYAEQIGQTGKTVAPNLYVALAVSGAVQHLSGMNRSKVIVAVNKDADAPIFKVTDYGIVGDVHEVVPPLIEALRDG